MLKMVDGTGIIGVDTICPLGVSAPQPPNYDRVELEGTGMLALPNSLNAPLERLELGGKTEQVQTSGKNLFDPNNNYEDLVWIRNDGEIVAGSNARTSDYIPVEQGNYAFQFDVINNNQMFVAGYNTDKRFVKIVGTISRGKCIIKIDNIEIETIRLSYTRESTRIQLERSETQTPYEPYTGGKPAPSPEYPQEIKNSGKWNEEKQKYEVSVEITGRNLFNGKLIKGKFITDDMNVVSDLVTMNTFDKPVEIEPNTDYVISANGVIWSGNINIYDESGKKIVQYYTGKFRTPSNAKYIRASIANAITPIDSKIQMEYGTTMNEFEQYHQTQTITLTSDRPITKWDRLVEQGGEIGWLYGTEKYVVTGQENFSYGSENYYTGSRVDMFFEIGDATGNEAIMRDLSFVPSIWHLTDKEGFCINGKQLHIGLYNTRIGVSDDAAKEKKIKAYKEFMAKGYADGNPFEVYYKTTETEFVPLPQSEQNAIRALKTYYPTTVITADGGELDPDIKVTYRKEK